MMRFAKFILCLIALTALNSGNKTYGDDTWRLRALPSSVRLDPVTNQIIEHRFKGVASNQEGKPSLLDKNWIYDGKQVSLHGARGEYVSFQLVLTNESESELTSIK